MLYHDDVKVNVAGNHRSEGQVRTTTIKECENILKEKKIWLKYYDILYR